MEIVYLRDEISHGSDFEKLSFEKFHLILQFIHDFIEKYENDELTFTLN